MGGFHAEKAEAMGLTVIRLDPRLGTTSADILKAAQKVGYAIIASPTSTHAVAAEPFISNGVPTLIEKPLAMTLPEAYWLREVADGEPVYVGYLNRFNAAWEIMSAIIWGAGKFTTYRSSRWVNDEYGGLELNLLTHDVDLVLQRWPDAQFTHVSSTSVYTEWDVAADDGKVTGKMVAEYEGEENVRLWTWDGKISEGFVTADLTAQSLKLITGNILVPDPIDQVAIQLDEFLNASPTVATLEDGIRAMEAVLPSTKAIV